METQTAVVVIDARKCFFEATGKWENEPGFGELGVPGGEAIVEPTNKVLAAAVEVGVYIADTAEAHPKKTGHFAQPPTKPNFVNTWPEHGVDGTPGAEAHPDLLIAQDPTLTQTFIKGDVVAKSPEDDTSYTGALAHDRYTGELLPDALRRRNIGRVILLGLALGDGDEYKLCVDSTAFDFKDMGFEVVVVTNAVEPVLPENREKCFANMGKAGIQLATSTEVIAELRG